MITIKMMIIISNNNASNNATLGMCARMWGGRGKFLELKTHALYAGRGIFCLEK